MESRWRDAVRMMDGWRKRMATSGQTVNLEELKAGLELSPVKDLSGKDQNTQDLEEGYEEGDTQADIDAMDDSQVPGGEDLTPDLDEMSDASSFEEEPEEDFGMEPVPRITAPPVQPAKPVEEEVVEQRQKRSVREARIDPKGSENTPEKKRKLEPQPAPSASSRVSKPRTDNSTSSSRRAAPAPRREQVVERQPEPEPEIVESVASSSPGPPPQLSPLRPIPDPNHRRKSEFTTIVEENTWDFAQLERSDDPVPESDEISLLKTSNAHVDVPPAEQPSARPAATATATPLKLTGASRLPRPASAMAQESPLTMASIAAKLAATEREADAARVRAKLKAAKLSSATAAGTSLAPPAKRGEVEPEPVKGGDVAEEAPRKRKASGRVGGRASRRRSTLSPWELESLILGGVAGSPAK
jgi:hypothetical protein